MFIMITTGMAILGALAVAKDKALFANAVWSISNPLLVGYNYYNGMVEQAVMFGVFTLVAWYGVYNLYSNVYIDYINERKGRE